MGEQQYIEYKTQLSGITEANAGELTSKLIELGLTPGAGQISKPADVDMRESSDPELKRLREVAVALLGTKGNNSLV